MATYKFTAHNLLVQTLTYNCASQLTQLEYQNNDEYNV